MTSSIDVLWRAANYLCAAQLYLRANVLLERPLDASDVKPNIVGHWGAMPGLNLLWALVSSCLDSLDYPVIPVLGSGHASSGMLACSYLEGSLGLVFPDLKWSRHGLETLVIGFGREPRFRTELSAWNPGIFTSNGELGPGLSVAQGLSIDQSDALILCVLGDGELETGPALAAFMASHELRARGHRLPKIVINLNGFRMGGPSVLEGIGEKRRMALFRGFGYRTIELDSYNIEFAQSAVQEGMQDPDEPVVLVLRCRKGVTFPESIRSDDLIVGTSRMHKAPLTNPGRNLEALLDLNEWLLSYRPHELFDRAGSPSSNILNALPDPKRRLWRQHSILSKQVDLSRTISHCAPKLGSNIDSMTAISSWLSQALEQHELNRQMFILSPDELISNRMEVVVDQHPNRIIEVLSEEVCHGWMVGIAQSGRIPVLSTYEAFASRFASEFAQAYKFQLESGSVPFRKTTPSMTYLLSSLGWHNVYSHQNPDFLSIAMLRVSESVIVSLPSDPIQAVSEFQECVYSHGRLNVIVVSKHALNVSIDKRARRQLAERGIACVHGESDPPDIVLVGMGDVCCWIVQSAVQHVSDMLPSARLRVIFVERPCYLSLWHPCALTVKEYREFFGDGAAIACFTGYAETARSLFLGRPNASNIQVLGYQDRTGTSFDETLRANGLAPEQVANLAVRIIRRP